MIMVAIYVDDNVYYFHEELCLSEGDQMMMMVNVMMMMLMITVMVVMMMTPISGSFSEVGGILSPITWLRFKLTISNTASEQIACLFMFCPFLDYCLCCPTCRKKLLAKILKISPTIKNTVIERRVVMPRVT